MPTQVTNYQCPSCTGPLHFSGASGRLECEYCGASYDVAEIEALYAEKEKKAAEAQQATEEGGAGQGAPAADGGAWDTSDFCEDWGAEGDGMRAYGCPSCGAELICEESTAATSCPYCGNPTVVPGQFSGALRPDFIVPFKLSKEDAVKALKSHYKGKFFLPKSFTGENHVQEIRGIYVPFWMFDGEAEGDAHYEAARSRTYRSGDYEITETKHYDVYRAGTVTFEKVPVDASSKMPVTVEQSRQRADQRCEGTLASALRGTVKRYDLCVLRESSVHLRRGKVHYALMPVWMLNTKWHGKDFLFAMNGQTGKLVGDLPVSWGKFWGLFAAIAVPLSVISSALVLLP